MVLKAIAMSLIFCACRPTPTPRENFHFGVEPGKANAPNTFAVVAARQSPFTLEVHVLGENEEWFFERNELATSHRVPLIGLGAEKTWTVSATLISENGDAFDTKEQEILTPSLPINFPILTELMGTPRPLGSGYLLFTVQSGSNVYNYTVIVDADLQVVWWREDPNSCSDLTQTPQGTLEGICNHLITEMAMTGETLSRKPAKADGRDDLNVHHELHRMPDGGYLSLHSETIEVDSYPISIAKPEVFEPSTIRGDELLRLDSNLRVIESWHVDELLPTTRIGFDSISRNPDAKIHDWSHSNGIIRDPQDNGIIVSVRHQDTLFKIDKNGALQWILSNPDGWPPEWDAYRLEGLGEFKYPHHQHAPELDENGRLWVFDNGNERDRTPYTESPDATPEYSRVVAYEVNQEDMTFKELISFDQTASGTAFSTALGDADWLPHLQSVLSVWGRFEEPSDNTHSLPGSNGFSSHILLHQPGQDAPIMDLELNDCRCDEETFKNEHKGWNSYRAEWLPALYAKGLNPTIVPLEQESD
jgi:arylsulfate sulfotransferase